MPRRARISFENSFYHVFNRGLNKEKIFIDNADYQQFLKTLRNLKEKKNYDHSIYSYVLMPNHFHLLLQVRKTPLSKVMSSLLTSFSMYFNKKYKRVGILFQNRFKSKLCDKDGYFLGASRYILLNPVESGLVKDPLGYPWSSFQEILGDFDSNVVDKMEIKRLIGEKEGDKKRFKEFVYNGINSIEKLKKEFNDFEKEIEGSAKFNTLSQKKYLRRKKRILNNIIYRRL